MAKLVKGKNLNQRYVRDTMMRLVDARRAMKRNALKTLPDPVRTTHSTYRIYTYFTVRRPFLKPLWTLALSNGQLQKLCTTSTSFLQLLLFHSVEYEFPPVLETSKANS